MAARQTTFASGGPKWRTYRDACGTALALDLMGEGRAVGGARAAARARALYGFVVTTVVSSLLMWWVGDRARGPRLVGDTALGPEAHPGLAGPERNGGRGAPGPIDEVPRLVEEATQGSASQDEKTMAMRSIHPVAESLRVLGSSLGGRKPQGRRY